MFNNIYPFLQIMAQSSKNTGVVSQTLSNMETSDSEESAFEVPIPVVQPKVTTPTPATKGKGPKGRKKKTTPSENSGDFDLVWENLPSTHPVETITNKCKIGKNTFLF